MTEEQILNAFRKEILYLLPILGNGLSWDEFMSEAVEAARKAMQQARREALRGN